MTSVRVKPGEYVDGAIKRFKKAVEADGVLRDARAHEFYVGPSEQRRSKSAAARRRSSA